jgi:hypothetical protein
MATLAGEPLYLACGFEPTERVLYNQDGVEIPLVRMAKVLPG